MKKYIGFIIVLSFLVFGAQNTFAALNVTNSNGTARACLPTTTPWIQIISPNGGETYTAGQQVTVNWASCNVNQLVGITLSGFPHPSSTQFFVGSWVQSSVGSEIISIPTSASAGNYAFNISTPPESSPSAEDWSDNYFTINTQPLAPTFTATPATFAGGPGWAVFNGTYNSNGSPITKIWFEYGTTTSLGTIDTSEYLKTSVLGTGPIGKSIGGFTAGQTYYYKICGLNNVNTSCSNIVSFVQPVVPTTPDSIALNSNIVFTKTLQTGVKDANVLLIQQALQKEGYLPASAKLDGSFGPMTLSAVQKYQAANNLKVDGKVGPVTFSKITGENTPVITTTPTENTSTNVNTVSVASNSNQGVINVFYVNDGLSLPSPTFAFLSGSGLSINPILKPILGLSIGQHGPSSSSQGEVSSITFKLLSSNTPLSPNINYYLINSVGSQVGQSQTLNNNEITFSNIGDTHSGTYDRRLFLTADQSFVGVGAKFVVTKLKANTYSGTQTNIIYVSVPCSKIILPEGNTSC